MPLIPVPNLDALRDLLGASSHTQPGLLLIGSQQWTSCVELQGRIACLAGQLPEFAFYDFNVDHYEEDFLHNPLMEIFSHSQIKYIPSQVLLPRNGRRWVISATDLDEITQQLAYLH